MAIIKLIATLIAIIIAIVTPMTIIKVITTLIAMIMASSPPYRGGLATGDVVAFATWAACFGAILELVTYKIE